jgi:hypothetical protein
MTPDSTIDAVLCKAFKSSLNQGARCLIYINHTFPRKARSPVAHQPHDHEYHRFSHPLAMYLSRTHLNSKGLWYCSPIYTGQLIPFGGCEITWRCVWLYGTRLSAELRQRPTSHTLSFNHSPPVQIKGRSIPLKTEKQSLICTSQSLYGDTQRVKSTVCIREGQASHSPCLYLLPTIPRSIPFPSPETPIMPIAPAQYHRCHHQAKGKKSHSRNEKKRRSKRRSD